VERASGPVGCDSPDRLSTLRLLLNTSSDLPVIFELVDCITQPCSKLSQITKSAIAKARGCVLVSGITQLVVDVISMIRRVFIHLIAAIFDLVEQRNGLLSGHG